MELNYGALLQPYSLPEIMDAGPAISGEMSEGRWANLYLA